jgi:hypothetical protein
MNGDSATALPTEQVPVPASGRAVAVRGDGAVAVVAMVAGALALGALAIGTMAIGRLAIGQLALGRAKLGRGQIHELRIAKFIIGDLSIETVSDLRSQEPPHSRR